MADIWKPIKVCCLSVRDSYKYINIWDVETDAVHVYMLACTTGISLLPHAVVILLISNLTHRITKVVYCLTCLSLLHLFLISFRHRFVVYPKWQSRLDDSRFLSFSRILICFCTHSKKTKAYICDTYKVPSQETDFVQCLLSVAK